MTANIAGYAECVVWVFVILAAVIGLAKLLKCLFPHKHRFHTVHGEHKRHGSYNYTRRVYPFCLDCGADNPNFGNGGTE